MTTFKYKAIAQNGEKVEGTVNAYNEFEATAKIRETCTVITKIEKVGDAADAQKKVPKVSDKALAILCSQFSIILSAGLPIVSCMKLVAEQQKNKEIKKMLGRVAEDIGGGYSMAAAFEKNNPKLPKTFIETIRAGEISGTLETCFARLQKYYEKTSKIKSKLISALIYPSIVIAVGIVVLIIIMAVAVPAFTKVFAELEIELPAVTKALIAVSNFFVGYWWAILLVVGIIAVTVLIVRQTEKGRTALSDFALTGAPLSKLRRMNCASVFASTISTMLSSGLQLTDCLRVTSSVITSYVLSREVDRVRRSVEQGGNMGSAMKNVSYFPPMLSEMTSVGEQSGTLEKPLSIIGDYFANEVDISASRLLSALEPVITVVLAVMTLLLLLAVYVPLFEMNRGI